MSPTQTNSKIDSPLPCPCCGEEYRCIVSRLCGCDHDFCMGCRKCRHHCGCERFRSALDTHLKPRDITTAVILLFLVGCSQGLSPTAPTDIELPPVVENVFTPVELAAPEPLPADPEPVLPNVAPGVTAESEPEPEPEPEEPEPEPDPPAGCSDVPRVESILGCFEGGAHASVTVAGEGHYYVALMKRSEPFTHETKSEGVMTVGCGESETMELDHIETTPPTEYELLFPPIYVVTVHEGSEELVYHELSPCRE